jgi:hypothetical protein
MKLHATSAYMRCAGRAVFSPAALEGRPALYTARMPKSPTRWKAKPTSSSGFGPRRSATRPQMGAVAYPPTARCLSEGQCGGRTRIDLCEPTVSTPDRVRRA